MSSADNRYVIIKKAEKGWCVVLGGRNDYLLEAEKKNNWEKSLSRSN